jgi:hypothetical protein
LIVASEFSDLPIAQILQSSINCPVVWVGVTSNSLGWVFIDL